MKRIATSAFLLLLFICLVKSASAQQSAPTQTSSLPLEPLTKLEALDTQVGVVIIKNYIFVGSVSGSSGIALVTAYEFVDAQTGRKDYGVGVEVRESARPERTSATYVD